MAEYIVNNAENTFDMTPEERQTWKNEMLAITNLTGATAALLSNPDISQEDLAMTTSLSNSVVVNNSFAIITKTWKIGDKLRKIYKKTGKISWKDIKNNLKAEGLDYLDSFIELTDGDISIDDAFALLQIISGVKTDSKEIAKLMDRLKKPKTPKSTKMLGENGVQTSSKTLWKGKGKERIDVENPNPGQRPGQVHYQDSNNEKYLYDPDTKKFIDKNGNDAPKSIQNKLNNPNFKSAIEKALIKYLGYGN